MLGHYSGIDVDDLRKSTQNSEKSISTGFEDLPSAKANTV